MTEKFIKVTLNEEMLGTQPNDEDIYREFIASKAPDAEKTKEEMESISVEEMVKKGMTVFGRMPDDTIFMWDYQIKGFFKDACGMLSRVVEKDENGKKKKGLTSSSKLSSYKKVIDGLIFTFPRKIPFFIVDEDKLAKGEDVGVCSRPLRAQTPMGERIALSSSETVPAGTVIVFKILTLSDDLNDVINEWLTYGQLRGLGQWRNSGKGRFDFEYITKEEYDKFYSKIK